MDSENIWIDIKTISEIKGITSRALRISLAKGKYISREIITQGGKSYEILLSSLEDDIQERYKDTSEQQIVELELESDKISLPTENFSHDFIPERGKMIALAKIDLLNEWNTFRNQYKTKTEADKLFIELYNSGEYLKNIFQTLGKTSRGSLLRWNKVYSEDESWENLVPQYKYSGIQDYKTTLTDEQIKIFLKILLHLIQFFGRKKLTKITNDDIKKFIELKQEQKLKNKRLRNCVTLLGNMFERFKEWNFVEKSPYNGITNVQYSREQRILILSDEEQKQILDEATKYSHNLYLFILLALNTGLKKAEILAIKVEDIDLKNNTICINKNLSEGVFVIPRGKDSIRKIVAPKDILAKLVENKAQDDFVFYDPSYSAFTLKKVLRREFTKVLKALNMPSITMNDLRHTYAYNALKSGMSIEYLHKQLGDYSIQATMDRYRDFISA